MAVYGDVVWLFRAAAATTDDDEDDDAYRETFKREGLRPVSLTTLQCKLCVEDQLQSALVKPWSYGGLVFTSRHAVLAIQRCIDVDNVMNLNYDCWSKKSIYVVGATTAAYVRRVFGKNVRIIGEESGSASELAELICKEPRQRPERLLFPCGRHCRPELTARLDEEGIPFHKLICYDMIESETLVEDTANVLQAGLIPRALAFFSPSGVNLVTRVIMPLFMKTLINVSPPLLLAAIGETTASAIRKAIQGGRIPHCTLVVAKKPTAEQLLEALRATS